MSREQDFLSLRYYRLSLPLYLDYAIYLGMLKRKDDTQSEISFCCFVQIVCARSIARAIT